MKIKELKDFVENNWRESIIEELEGYIRIPCLSPMFDRSWENNNLLLKACEHVVRWIDKQEIKNSSVEIIKENGKTPIIMIEVDGDREGTILFYGHLDKQPEAKGWDDDKGPYKPVIQNGKLFGRGSADDGYAVYTAISSIKALQEQNVKHGRCVVLIETCEESGSLDLPYYLEKLEKRIGSPDLVVCLDSGCGNFEQFWVTTSLRGALACELKVDILKEGIHSGNSGVIPSSFRIMRQLLSRVENEETGEILLDELNTEIPEERVNQALTAEKVLGYSLISSYPLYGDLKTISSKISELILQRTWKPSLSYIAADGIPPSNEAANLLRPSTSFVLSFRAPPTANLNMATEKLKEIFESSPPYDSKVSFRVIKKGSGWHMPDMPAWLSEAVERSSRNHFGKEPVFMGEGGSIPLMNLLSEKFPKSKFIVTGVLGPGSNAHGPNEFLHLRMVEKVTCVIAEIIEAHGKKNNR
jgi:acetylornithine deacetylase/succinyl-diaminopimelate desuccinylase-like protein